MKDKPLGFNPLRWDCKKDGCFNDLRRPKIEEFAMCFPGRVNFGDADGLVEINGYFGLLEWKGDGGTIKLGQKIAFEQFTRHRGNAVFVVEGNAETMKVKRYSCFWKGRQRDWHQSDLDGLRHAIKSWAKQARAGRFGAKAAA